MKIDRIFNKLIWACLLLIMLIPIYINSNFFFPFIFGKALAFRILVEVLLLLWLAYIWVKKEFKIKIDWATIIFFVLLVFMFISSLLGSNFYLSFWSNIERSEGLLLWSHMFVLFLILRNFISSKQQWLLLYDAFFFSAQVVVFIGLLQYFKIDLINYFDIGDRVASTIGNASYLAGYALFAAFFGLYLIVKRHNQYLNIYYIIAIMVDLFIMMQTGTRGAFVAAIIGILIFIVYNLFRINNQKLRYYLLAIGLLFCILISLVFVNKTSNFVQNNEALRRLTSISTSERTAQTRFMAWDSAWQGFKEKPILGYGQENFYVVFNKYFNPEIYSHAGSSVWFDRAHNIFLDHLITGGLIGLVLYCLLIFWPLYIILKRVLKEKKEESKTIDFGNQILALAMITFIIQGVFVFESIVTYIPLFLIITLIVQKYTEAKFNFTNRKAILILLIIYAVCFLPMMYRVNIKEAKANLVVVKGMRLLATDIDLAINTYFEAIDYRTSGSNEYRRRVAEVVDSLVVNQTVDPYQVVKYVDRVDEELKMRITEVPEDVANYVMFMRHYNYTYILDPNRLYEVAKLGKIVLEYSPTRPQIYYELGYADLYLYKWLMDQGKVEEAKVYQQSLVDNFQKAIDLNNDVMESYVNMIMVLLTSNQADQVQKYVDIMDELDLKYKLEEPITRMANSAIYAKEFEWSKKFFTILVEEYPNNPSYYIQLALSYANLDENDKAIAIAEDVKKFGEPYISQSEAFIQTIRSGKFIKEINK